MNWQRRWPRAIRSYEFPREERVDHDFIDTTNPVQRIEVVYPKLLEFLESGAGNGEGGEERREE